MAVTLSPATQRLARTPNLLTLMAVVHREKTTLPDGKAVLYDEIANAYIHTIDDSRKLTTGPDPLGAYDWRQRKAWLAYVAFCLQTERAKEDSNSGILATEGNVRAWLTKAMTESGVADASTTAAYYLAWLTRRSGLFLPRGEGLYAFVHLSFQEYFCACFLYDGIVSHTFAKKGKSADGLITKTELCSWAKDIRWRETFVFLFEKLSSERNTDWADDIAESLFGVGGDLIAKGDSESLIALATRIVCDGHVRLSADQREALIGRCSLAALRNIQEPWLNTREIFSLMADAGLAREVSILNEAFLEEAKRLPDLRVLVVGGDAEFDATILRRFPRLIALHIGGGAVSDLGPLSGLVALKWLSLSDSNVSDLRPLAGLTALAHLSLNGSQVSDLRPLSGLAALAHLSLNETQVSDLNPLSGLTALEWLSLVGTHVSDLRPLSRLTALEWLHLAHTKVDDLGPLSGLTRLQGLFLVSTGISDLSPLSDLTDFIWLDLSGTEVGDLSPLSGMTRLRGLFISSTEVSDLSALSGLTNLRWLYLDATEVTDLSPLSGLMALQDLSLNGAKVSDLSPLLELPSLQHLNIQNTGIQPPPSLLGRQGLIIAMGSGEEIED